MRKVTLFTVMFLSLEGYSQLNLGFLQVDSLQRELAMEKRDTSRVILMAALCEGYRWSNPDSAMKFGLEGLALAQKIRFPRGEANALISISVVQRELGNLPLALDYGLKALKIVRDNDLNIEAITALIRVGNVYAASRSFEKALQYLRQAEEKSRAAGSTFYQNVSRWLIAAVYDDMNKPQEALSYVPENPDLGGPGAAVAYTYNILGNILMHLQRDREAISKYWTGMQVASVIRDYRTASNIYIALANYYKRENARDSAIYYAQLGLTTAQSLSYKNRVLSSSTILADLYEATDPAVALKYYKIAMAARDTIFGLAKMQALQNTAFDEMEKHHRDEQALAAARSRTRILWIGGGLLLFLGASVVLFRNNRQKQKANELLKMQKDEIDYQRAKAEEAVSKLKATQAQLIQSEKMASLGELTAGIAHEIQNPLNFVNNFSEVNLELLEEIQREWAIGNKQWANEAVDNLKQNLEKIAHHGKRADAIVKNMLQHSNKTTGTKEMTDINGLVDEYLRLSYHGFRAKDNSFKAIVETHFDPSLGKVNVVGQDIGRVLLNIFNNSFYAVQQKQKNSSSAYEPVVQVSTKRIGSPSGLPAGQAGGEGIEISIKDNGTGIPEKVLEKIYQPFFTTKPTGEGTGLGLSLSYDIITKGHNGELTVETKEGEGAEFIVTLPMGK